MAISEEHMDDIRAESAQDAWYDEQHEAMLEAQTDRYYEWLGEHCCEAAMDFDGETMYGFDHAETCDNYDGAPVNRPGMTKDDPVRCDND